MRSSIGTCVAGTACNAPLQEHSFLTDAVLCCPLQNEHDSRSPEAYTVLPGDTLTQSVVYVPANNSYTMYIASARSGKSILWNYKLEPKQGDTPESTAYIVVEHQPASCDMFPTNGNITFSSIVVEVEGEVVTNPTWVVQQERPACSSKAVVLDGSTVMLQWSSKPDALV